MLKITMFGLYIIKWLTPFIQITDNSIKKVFELTRFDCRRLGLDSKSGAIESIQLAPNALTGYKPTYSKYATSAP